MKVDAKEIVLFSIPLDVSGRHYGILFEDGRVLCFCCGGYIEPDDYKIIERCDWNRIDETLLKDY